jgi:hypothetical protein
MKKEDILANCIDEIQSGKSTLEDCLARYPELGDELRPLLNIATSIPPEKITPALEFKQRARKRLLDIMQPPATGVERRGAGIFGWLQPLVPAMRPSLALIVAIVMLTLLAAGATTAYASQGSLPDDTLYPVKTGVENLQLALTLSPEARAALHLKLAQRRIDEVIAQSILGRKISTSALEAVAVQIDAAIAEIESMLPEDIKTYLSRLSESTINQQVTLSQVLDAAPEDAEPAVKQALDATRRGSLIAKVAYGNPAFLGSLPSVLDEGLEAAFFKLEGPLLSVEGGTWNIGGLLIQNANSSQGTFPIGSRVEIEGLVRGGQIFISEIELEEETDDRVKIRGIFGGTSPDGTIWYVSGIPIGQPQNVAPPPRGSELKLEGVIQNGVFTVTKMESDDDENGKVKIEGVLVQVDRGQKIIAIEVAGAQVTVNISEDTETRGVMEIGRMVEVEVVVQDDGSLLALKIEVEDGEDVEEAVDEDSSEEVSEHTDEHGDEEESGEGEEGGEESEGEGDEGEGEGDDEEED